MVMKQLSQLCFYSPKKIYALIKKYSQRLIAYENENAHRFEGEADPRLGICKKMNIVFLIFHAKFTVWKI